MNSNKRIKEISIKLIVLFSTCVVGTGCNETSNTNNNTNTLGESPSSEAITPNEESDTESVASESESHPISPEPHKPKTDGEVILEASEVLLDGITDMVEMQRVKDSIRQANKSTMFAYQIGVMMRESLAYEEYRKLKEAKIPSVYVFKVGRKEYYLVQFEAKGQEELSLEKGEFKTKLGELGSEGLSIVNLNDFCSKRETVIRCSVSEDGETIKCLQCD